MLLSINPEIVNKGNLSTFQANNGFINSDLSPEQLVEKLNDGIAFTCQLKGSRNSENFLSAGYVALDIDETWTVEEALRNPFIKNNGTIIYTTVNHKPKEAERFRVVFELEEPIYTIKEYRKLMEGLLDHFPQGDPSTKDPARCWFGSKGCEPILLNRLMSKKEITAFIKKGDEITKNKESCKSKSSYDLPIEEAEKMLSFIDPQPGYEIWRNICFGLANAYGDDAILIIENWSPDDKYRGRHLRQLVNRSNGRITLGTVIYHAIEGGYQLPESIIKKRRTAGQVAYEDVFECGFNYATIGFNLFRYRDGYYEEIPDSLALKQVAQYFYRYPTSAGRNAYATDAKIISALNFVKNMVQSSQKEINPAGINLGNGFLKPVYNDKGKVDFELLPHTSERICTYRAAFDYIPKADPSAFKKIINDMLPKESQNILFGVLASSLDLQEVRKRHGRDVRLLLLYGSGANGKDTIKEWISMLYGGHGLTAVTLQAFKKGDGPSNFSLAPLVYSRVNWSSENAAISIDRCQTLKNFASGDEINVEKKNEQGFTIKPNAIGIFNINEWPHIESTQEAIRSRYAVIEFPNIFKSNPDPNKPYECKANPRIKNDPEFIENQILPVLLNHLINHFKEVLENGIDYSSIEHLMHDIRSQNSHLLEFIEDLGLVECDHKDGLPAAAIFNKYMLWCEKKSLAVLSEEPIGIRKANNPSDYDTIITNPNQITPRFRKLFPKLSSNKVNGVRKLNIKFSK